jgi:hypothetical protein
VLCYCSDCFNVMLLCLFYCFGFVYCCVMLLCFSVVVVIVLVYEGATVVFFCVLIKLSKYPPHSGSCA